MAISLPLRIWMLAAVALVVVVASVLVTPVGCFFAENIVCRP